MDVANVGVNIAVGGAFVVGSMDVDVNVDVVAGGIYAGVGVVGVVVVADTNVGFLSFL